MSIRFSAITFIYIAAVFLFPGENGLCFTNSNTDIKRSFSQSVTENSEIVTVTVTFTNNTIFGLNGFYFTQYVPRGIIVDSLSVNFRIGDSVVEVSDYIFEFGKRDDIFSGYIAYQWILETPPEFSQNNSIPPGGSLQIVFSLTFDSCATFDLNEFNWVGYFSDAPIDSKVTFGYSEEADAYTLVYNNLPDCTTEKLDNDPTLPANTIDDISNEDTAISGTSQRDTETKSVTSAETPGTYDAAFQPPVAATTAAMIEDHPNIEIFDSNFRQLEWLKSGWDDYINANGEARVAAGDIDQDGKDEIIIGFAAVLSAPNIPGGFFQILDDDFSHLTWGRIQWTEYNAANGETWPACGDIDGDGDDEIIIGLGHGGHGYMEVFDFANGEAVHHSWFAIQWPEYNALTGEARPVCKDLDGDGLDEIIVGLGSINSTTTIPGGRFEIFSPNFDHMAWGVIEWPDYAQINGETWPATGDLDGDGTSEIVVGMGEGGNGKMGVFQYTENDVTLKSWAAIDWPEYNNLSGETRPVCGDIDKDSKDEIVIGLGPLYDDPEIPNGLIQVLDDNLDVMQWGQIDYAAFNAENGESRPVIINGGDKIVVGLGSWQRQNVAQANIGRDENALESTTDEDNSAKSESGGGAGCFIGAAGVTYVFRTVPAK